jgi:hypothetical protein
MFLHPDGGSPPAVPHSGFHAPVPYFTSSHLPFVQLYFAQYIMSREKNILFSLFYMPAAKSPFMHKISNLSSISHH